MPGFDSFVKAVAKGQKLLSVVSRNAGELPGSEALRAQLEQALTRLQELQIRRDNLNAEKQVLSKQLVAEAHVITNAVMDLKALAKAVFGSRSERLTEFGITPRRQVLRSDRVKARTAPAASKAPALGDPAA